MENLEMLEMKHEIVRRLCKDSLTEEETAALVQLFPKSRKSDAGFEDENYRYFCAIKYLCMAKRIRFTVGAKLIMVPTLDED